MTELLCLKDSYCRECDATVSKVDGGGKKVFVDRTVFYPQGGGQPSDTGKIIRISDNAEFRVEKVAKESGEAAHYLDKEGLAVGDSVKLVLDWERRHKIMRMHTAAHVLGFVMFERGVQITGNQLGDALTRFDFNVETGLQREAIEAGVAKANELLRSGAEVKVFELPREEAFKIPGIVKLADKLPPAIAVLRIVQIGDFDVQADGGTHVRNVSEIGQLHIERIENKGAANKRVYLSLSNP